MSTVRFACRFTTAEIIVEAPLRCPLRGCNLRYRYVTLQSSGNAPPKPIPQAIPQRQFGRAISSPQTSLANSSLLVAGIHLEFIGVSSGIHCQVL